MLKYTQIPNPLEPGKFDKKKIEFNDHDKYNGRWASHPDIVEKVFYGRYGDLTPKVSEFIPTLNCPYRCSTCHFRRLKETLGIWKQNKKSDLIEMPLSSAESFLDKLINGGCTGIHFTGGGEPTLYPYLAEIAQHCKKAGGQLSISSNGTFIRGIKPEQIIELGFHQIRISLDTVKSHAAFHGYDKKKKDYLQDVLKNIKIIIKTKKEMSSSTRIIICILFDERNYEEIPDLGHAIVDLGKINHVVIRPVQDYYRSNHVSKKILTKAIDMINDPFTSELEKAGIKVIVPKYRLTSFDNVQKRFSQCRACSLIGGLWPDGRMFMCTETNGCDNFCIGSLKDETLKEVYSSRRYQSVRLGVGHDRFKHCPVTARPLKLNLVFEKIEALRQKGEFDLLERWLTALHSMYDEPNPWIQI